MSELKTFAERSEEEIGQSTQNTCNSFKNICFGPGCFQNCHVVNTQVAMFATTLFNTCT